ncbi:MAG TPA: choice-of-anchor tandem repeat GloVer-containing protein [Verrucomicrobiae bacterium]|nr:choice-of-anchor tandem repeat GloVer-containing protein [Verrucomicrobiae bacterium]
MKTTGEDVGTPIKVLIVACAVLGLGLQTRAQDVTITNLDQLAQVALSPDYSLWLPFYPWQWQAYPTDWPLWCDFTQMASLESLPTSTNVVPWADWSNVPLAPVVLTKDVLSGVVTISADGTNVIATVPAPSGYQPGTGMEDHWLWAEYVSVTNDSVSWGLTPDQILPPTVTLRTYLADSNAYYSAYQSNLEVEAEAAAQFQNSGTTSAGPAFTAMASESAVMMDGSASDPCATTDFSIQSLTMSTQGCTLVWNSCPDVYVVQKENSLTPTSSWTDVAWMLGAIQTTSTSWTDTNALGQPQEFYRVFQAAPNTLNNGIPYSWAVSYGLDPLNPNLASETLNGSCLNNYQAYLQGTDPLTPSPIMIDAGTVYAGSTSNTASVIPNLTPMYSFDYPSPMGMIQSAIDSNFYGSASTNLTADLQPTIIFKMTPQGAATTLYAFTTVSNGYYPSVPMLGSNGNLYGVCYLGGNTRSSYCNGTVVGYGTVFQLTTQGVLTNLHIFAGPPEGSCPIGGLIQGTDGNFYGVTEDGGTNNCSGSPMEEILSMMGTCCDPTYGGYGTVFKLTPQGTFTTLHTFSGGSDGAWPEAALLQGSDGYLYGTTSAGNGNAGTVFKMSTNGTTFTNLHAFTGGADGATPLAALIQDGGGYLYGTAFGGGTNGNGTVFKVDTNGITYVALHSFGGIPDGSYPGAGLVQGTDGNFYGTTVYGGPSAGGDGTVFRITPQGTFTTVYQFTGGATGAYPDYGPLVQSSIDGYFYGTTLYGGDSGWGTVFKCAPPTYTWSLTSGTFTTGQGSPYLAFATPSPCPVTLNVAATNRLLGCSNSGSITVTPSAPLPSANSPITQGQTLTLSVPTVAGATYLWTGPNSFGTTNQNPAIPYAQPWNSGQYCVAACANGCTSLASCVSVTVSPSSSMLVISSAWASYIDSNHVGITANVVSTNSTVNVKAAEYFLDAVTGTNGAGTAMSASNSVFGSTNVTAVATFAPTFTNGERHVIYLHAEGSDGQWTPFQQVVLNPNANDIVNKVQANYAQIADITYTLTRSEYFEGQVANTSTVLYRQLGPTKMRWDNLTTGAITIINGTEMDVIDETGQLNQFTLISTSSGNDQPLSLGQFFWNIGQFTAQHALGTVASSTNGPASYVINASPNAGTGLPYDSMSCEVDLRYGVVTSFSFSLGGQTETTVQQAQPQQVAPGVWFHSQQTCVEPLTTNWNMQFTETFQTNTVQINTGTVSNQLFQVTGQ